MFNVKIYRFEDTNQFALKSTLDGNESYRKFYLMTLDPTNRRVTFIFPFGIDDVGDFNKGVEYAEILPTDPEYAEYREEARHLAMERLKNHHKRIKEEKAAGKLSDLEFSSDWSAVKSFYDDLLD